MLGDDIAVADAPIVFKAHEADAAFACKLSGFPKRELAFRLGDLGLENAMHGLDVAAPCRFATELRRAERLHMNIADAGVGKACCKHVLGEAGASRKRNVANVHQRLYFGASEGGDEIPDANALVADRPDAAH